MVRPSIRSILVSFAIITAFAVSTICFKMHETNKMHSAALEAHHVSALPSPLPLYHVHPKNGKDSLSIGLINVDDVKPPKESQKDSSTTQPTDELQMTETILYYYCGSNVAIVHMYANLKGDTLVRTYSRWDYPSYTAYMKELVRLLVLVGDPATDTPVYIFELNNSCTKA